MIHIAVFVEGGIVTAVVSDTEGVRVRIVDYDDQAEDPSWETSFEPVEVNPETVHGSE